MTLTEKSTSVSSQQFSLLKIILTVFCVIMVRLFLENFVYPDSLGYFFPIERILHAVIYFFSLFISLSLLLYFFTKETLENIFCFMTKIYLFILLVPIADIVFNLFTTKTSMAYLIIYNDKILPSFFQLLNPLSRQGVTLGQYVAAYSILMSMAIFVYQSSKSIKKAIFILIAGYATLFAYEILPSFLLLFSGSTSLTNTSALNTYYNFLNQSWLAHYTEGLGSIGQLLFKTELAHELTMAKMYVLSLNIQTIVTFIIFNKKNWLALKDELRIERIFFWIITASIGIIINQKIFGDLNLLNPVNIISLTVFFVLIMLNIWLAVFINDEEDIAIDKISNPSRPLVAEKISLSEWRIIQLILFLLIVLGTATLNKSTAILLILIQAMYYIYSSWPLRLKRHFLLSSFITGFAAVVISMAGFFLVSPDQHFSAFPIKAIFITGIAYALISNFKDIKDFDGDKHEKIKTVPVVFGLRRAKFIISALSCLVFISIPIFLKDYSMITLSIFISIFASYILTKKEYKEKYVFLILLIYSIGLFLMTK